jgi:soluble lytic murein transglycosylase
VRPARFGGLAAIPVRPDSRHVAVRGGLVVAVAILCFLDAAASSTDSQDAARQANGAAGLVPTIHPPVPAELSTMWLAPPRIGAAPAAAYAGFVRGVRLIEESDDAAAALPLVSAGALASTPIDDYARYYTGLALQRLNRLAEAEAHFAALAASNIDGHLPEDAALRLGEVRERRLDHAGAREAYEALLGRGRISAPQVVLMRIGTVAEATGARDRAVEMYRRIYREYPLSSESSQAEAALTRLDAWDFGSTDQIALELPRAQTLFRARRWSDARSAYARLRDHVKGDERELVDLRLAALDVLDGGSREARGAAGVLRRLAAAEEPRAEEARFYLLGATRASGEHDEFKRLTRQYVAAYPASAFAEEALNNLATHHILVDEDARAEEIFGEMLQRFPTGRYAERAAWRAGWWAYRAGDYRRTIDIFERGAAAAPRSDYRPAWLFWSARCYERLGDNPDAVARYQLAATDYLNSYYGRLASRRLAARQQPRPAPNVKRITASADAPSLPPTKDRITLLMSLGLWRDALNELQFAQRVWGDSPRVQATVALVQNRLGNLRPAINVMKRAYPQYLAAGGEDLPREILEVLFPVDYWPLIQRHAAARGLDPYLIAALVAQESTFDPIIRSSANAIGLMQILPSTGRQYARRLGMRSFSVSSLIEPETNVRLGTTYFNDLIAEFGGAHFALASYNAGESRVREWKAERPGLEQDEFIDDIPFPETQNYVKRILGTAEDYRRLYTGATTESMTAPPSASTPAAAARKKTTASAPAKKAPAKKAPAKKPPAKKRRT